jgi:ankyrin repeat protein
MSRKPFVPKRTFKPTYHEANTTADAASVATILGKALTGGATELIRAMIDNKASLGVKNESGKTVLHLLMDNEKLSSSQLLNVVKSAVENGAPIDVADADGVRPLHLAAKRQNKEVVDYFLEKGAEPNSLTNTKMTPLHYAVVPKTVNCEPRSAEVQNKKMGVSESPKKQIKKNTDELTQYIFDKLRVTEGPYPIGGPAPLNDGPFIMYLKHLALLASEDNFIAEDKSDIESARQIVQDVVANGTTTNADELRQLMRRDVKSLRDRVYQRALTEFKNGLNETDFNSGTDVAVAWGPEDENGVVNDNHKIVSNFSGARDWFTDVLRDSRKNVENNLDKIKARYGTLKVIHTNITTCLDTIKSVFTILKFMIEFEKLDTDRDIPRHYTTNNQFPPNPAHIASPKVARFFGGGADRLDLIMTDQATNNGFEQKIALNNHTLTPNPGTPYSAYAFDITGDDLDSNLVNLNQAYPPVGGGVNRQPFRHTNKIDYLDFAHGNNANPNRVRSVSDMARYYLSEMMRIITAIETQETDIRDNITKTEFPIDEIVEKFAYIQLHSVSISYGIYFLMRTLDILNAETKTLLERIRNIDGLDKMIERYDEIFDQKVYTDLKKQRRNIQVHHLGRGPPGGAVGPLGTRRDNDYELYERNIQGERYYVLKNITNNTLKLVHLEHIDQSPGAGGEVYYDRKQNPAIRQIATLLADPLIRVADIGGQLKFLNVYDTPEKKFEGKLSDVITKNMNNMIKELKIIHSEVVGIQEDLKSTIQSFNEHQGVSALYFVHNLMIDTSYQNNVTSDPGGFLNYLYNPIPPNLIMPKDYDKIESTFFVNMQNIRNVQLFEVTNIIRRFVETYFYQVEDVRIMYPSEQNAAAPPPYALAVDRNPVAGYLPDINNLYQANFVPGGIPGGPVNLPGLNAGIIGFTSPNRPGALPFPGIEKIQVNYPILKHATRYNLQIIKYLLIMYVLQHSYSELNARQFDPAVGPLFALAPVLGGNNTAYTDYVTMVTNIDAQNGEAMALSTIGKMADEVVISTYKKLIATATNIYVHKVVFGGTNLNDTVFTKIFGPGIPDRNLYIQSLITRPDEELHEIADSALSNIYARYGNNLGDLRFMSRSYRDFKEDIGEQIRRMINADSTKDIEDICLAMDEAVAMTLISHGASVNPKDSALKTPLDYAVDLQNVNAIQALVAAGAAIEGTPVAGLVMTGGGNSLSTFEVTYNRLMAEIRASPMFNLNDIEHRIASHMVEKFGINVIPDKSIAILRIAMYMLDHQLTMIANRYPNMYERSEHQKVINLIGIPEFDNTRLPLASAVNMDTNQDLLKETVDGSTTIETIEKLSREIIRHRNDITTLRNQRNNLVIDRDRFAAGTDQFNAIDLSVIEIDQTIRSINNIIRDLSDKRTASQNRLDNGRDRRINTTHGRIDNYRINNKNMFNNRYNVNLIYTAFFLRLNGINGYDPRGIDETTFEYITYFQLWSTYLTDLSAHQSAGQNPDYTQLVKATQSYILNKGDDIKSKPGQYLEFYQPFSDLYQKVFAKYGSDYFDMSMYLTNSAENYALKQVFDIMNHVFKHTISIDIINVTAGLLAKSMSTTEAQYRVAVPSTFDILMSSGFVKECLSNLPKRVIKTVCLISEGENDPDVGVKTQDILDSTLLLLESASFSGVDEATMVKIRTDISTYYAEYARVYTAEMHSVLVRQLKSLMAQAQQLEILSMLGTAMRT